MNLWLFLLAVTVTAGAGCAMFLMLVTPARRRPPAQLVQVQSANVRPFRRAADRRPR